MRGNTGLRNQPDLSLTTDLTCKQKTRPVSSLEQRQIIWNAMDTTRTTGLTCPQCSGFIPLSIEQLLKSGSITCPHCNLHLTINRKVADKTQEMLEKNKCGNKKKADA